MPLQYAAAYVPKILDTMGFGVFVIDVETEKIAYANEKILKMGGYKLDEVIGKSCRKLLCLAHNATCPVFHTEKSPKDTEGVLICADQSELSVIKTVAPLSINEKHYIIECLMDNSHYKKVHNQLLKTNEELKAEIERREEIQGKIKYLAYHDNLTGLPNRLLFNNKLDSAINLSMDKFRPLVVMFLDIDGFKKVNDTLGHAKGDTLLIEISNRLEGVLRKTDTVARFGGDEFVVMIDSPEEATDIKFVVDKILQCFNKPFVLEGEEFYITTSVGVARYPKDGKDAATLINNADAAMYKAKAKGPNQWMLCP